MSNFQQTETSTNKYNTNVYGQVEQSYTDGNSVYSKVMAWLMVAFLATGFGTMFIGPMVPVSMINVLWIVALAALILSGFVRHVKGVAPALTIIIPTILGITLYPTINYYLQTGSGNIILSAAFGTAIVFGTAAILGWRAEKNKVESKMPIMTGVLIALIVTSILNVFIFKLTALSFIISLITIPLFALYSYYDLNKLRNNPNAMPPASYALNIFLDIFNIFVSILNILGMANNR